VTEFAVRRCTESEWSEVRRLHIQMALGVPLAVDVELNDVFSTPESFWRHFTSASALGEDQVLFVAEHDHTRVGMGHVRRDHDVARLAMLYVKEALRRRGIGSALLTAQEQWARENGLHDLVAHIPDTSPATTLAERSGWRRTDELYTAKNRLVERRWTKRLP
jgi:GNAT superfamily N-acetyltransferase